MKLPTWWRFWAPPAAYLSLIFTLSSFSSLPEPPGISLNALHFPEYALLAILLARAYAWTKPGASTAGACLFSWIASTAWGVLDETHQAFVPGRVPDLSDLWHDAAGAALGLAVWLLWKAARAKRC